MWTRRETLVNGSVNLLWLFMGACPCLAGARHDPALGCTLADSEADAFFSDNPETRLYFTGNEPMIPKSGDANFDLALAQTLAKISDRLTITPGFAYYDDYDGMNAYASPRVRLSNADGTVLFGQRLLKRLMAVTDNPEIGVAAVCAHEFGHILQYKKGLAQIVGANQPTVKRVELQADFFAGYFAGLRKLEKRDFPAAVFAMTQYTAGDDQINSRNHHGTPDERAAAVVRGFEAAYVAKKSLGDAIETSINYVKTL
jgi:hypothetical protein